MYQLWEGSNSLLFGNGKIQTSQGTIQKSLLWKKNPQQHKWASHRRTCRSPGVTVPGRMTPAPPVRVPSWTWKTGRRVRPEDCNRVFNTSRGQVTMAPTVPLHLQKDYTKIRINRHKQYCTDQCMYCTLTVNDQHDVVVLLMSYPWCALTGETFFNHNNCRGSGQVQWAIVLKDHCLSSAAEIFWINLAQLVHSVFQHKYFNCN